MLIKRLNYQQTLKSLEKNDCILVYWSPFNGEIRRSDYKTIGTVSTRIMDKILNSDLVTHVGNGEGLLNHEKYYKLKNKQ